MVNKANVFIPDAFNSHRYLVDGPLGCYINGADMGVGKTLSGIAAIYLKHVNERDKFASQQLPANHKFWPNLWVTKPELDSQSLSDFMRAFKGLMKFYVLTSSANKKYPSGVTVIRNNTEWLELSQKLYGQRHEPKVCLVPRPSFFAGAA